MAHKHNRRRIRPRNRNNILQLTWDITEHTPSSLQVSSPYSSPLSKTEPTQPALPPTLRNPSSSLTSKNWYNRYVAWQNRDLAQKREAIKLEAEQIKLFGGEPGDDVGLCYKMLEVFAGMNWIDTLD
ncbi:uncharacterized protein PV06_07547 [Exophiala oligosperma]|uniref:Uncharacterized protein n=2 Tax=Chaetothyriales TaxID=34395 RepID=A0A0D2DD00_9EURO|nr:uncharacterized protein PV06_07547 [Exophiala oligosperma]KAJ9617539.1 hypothetical protein H2204_013670 [Knufia peltigerae]KIW40340.1 hypothetical protein PV06_07547 [Exophiala oligosperma]